MSPDSIFPPILSLLFLCPLLPRSTNSKLVASSPQRLVAVGEAYQAVCHYSSADTERYLYWTVHSDQKKDNDAEPQHNFGGIDTKSCLAFSFDSLNSEFAFNTSLFGLSGQIICDLDRGIMGLRIDNVQPEYNGISFSCTAGINTSTRSNKITLLIGKSKLVTLEIDMTVKGHVKGNVKGNLKSNLKGNLKGNVKGNLKGNVKDNLKGSVEDNGSDEGSAALVATCRVDRSLRPQLLVWASTDSHGGANETSFGGLIPDLCFRYKNIGSDRHGNVSFTCNNRKASSLSSTFRAESLPEGTEIFCYVILDGGATHPEPRLESNRLVVSKRGRFTKIYLSANDTITISGAYFAGCRGFDSGDLLVGFCQRVQWQGLRQFGPRSRVSCNEKNNESFLVIKPIYATDNQSEIFCKVEAEESERVVISIAQTRPNPNLELLRNESTTEPIALNGTFKAVCSFKEINIREMYWFVTKDNVMVGRVDIFGDICRSYIMIEEKEVLERVSISCDLRERKSTFSVHFTKAGDTGTEIYCSATDQTGMAIRSDSLTLHTRNDSRKKASIVKSRPAYKEATFVTTCDYDSGSELLFLLHPPGEDINNGSEAVETGNRTFILIDRNCSVIDSAFYLERRFFIECDQKNLSVNLIMDPVDGNVSDVSEVSCISYGYISSTTNTSSTSKKRTVSLKHPIWRLVYPVTVPVLKYRGDQFVINETQSGNLSWIIPVLSGQEMEFSCVAENSRRLTFNLSLYIQSEEGFAFQIQDQRNELNLTTSTSITSATIRLESTFKGIFCVAENLVSRWESDIASFKLRNASVFMGVPGKGALESKFIRSQKIPTLKLCFKLCEINDHCLGVTYHNKSCSLSKFSPLDVQFETGNRFYFYHRLQPKYLLERNDFQPDVYTKHENRTLSLDSYLHSEKGITVSECQQLCSRFLPCQSIEFIINQNVCLLSEVMLTLKKGTPEMTKYGQDVYARSYTPGSFVVLQNWTLNIEIKSVAVFPFFCSGKIEQREMQGIEHCRNRKDCVAFSIKQEENGMNCYWHNINIPELPLKKFGQGNSVYVRVRNLNDLLIPVKRFQLVPIA